jgi:hypothetical protein
MISPLRRLWDLSILPKFRCIGKHRLQPCPLELFDAVRSWSVAALRFSIGIIIVGD